MSDLLKLSIKFSEVQEDQLNKIMEIDGFTNKSEALRATLRYYYENKINKPSDNGEKNEDTLDIRDK